MISGCCCQMQMPVLVHQAALQLTYKRLVAKQSALQDGAACLGCFSPLDLLVLMTPPPQAPSRI
jgi:hypothetical protein